MNPKKRGTPIDVARYTKWIHRFAGYRRTVTKRKIQDWIGQFEEADRDIAARVLDCVEFINLEQLETGLASVLSKLPGWDPVKKNRRGKWRFVAFSMSAAESGQAMIYTLRSAARLNATRYDELFVYVSDLPSEELGPDDSVVFVDDIAGTGSQACTGWPELLAELLPEEPNLYLVLAAASTDAADRIHNETRMSVRNWRTLRHQDNLFSLDCTHFSAAEKRRILTYCRTADRNEPKGFGDCGLLVVFPHKTPNDSIPVLHKYHQNWSGLFPR